MRPTIQARIEYCPGPLNLKDRGDLQLTVKKIEWNGKIFALILRKELEPKDTKFFTSKDNSLQLGIIKHEKGYTERPHVHKHSKKIIHDVQEILHIAYGKVRVNFYNDDGERVKSAILTEGDTILLAEGGHAIEVLETFKGIKAKQGPYKRIEEDKRYLR